MFKRETLDFLAENRLRDSKEWFDEHKNEYKKYVHEPLSELVEALAPAIKEIDTQFITEPKSAFQEYTATLAFQRINPAIAT